MFGSYYLELAVGLAFLGVAAVLWGYLLRAFRRKPLPALLSYGMAGEISTIVEVALLAFGTVATIDALARAIP
jgi:hypothetical protein